MRASVHFWVIIILTATLSLAAVAAKADTERGQFLVSVTVLNECHVVIQGLSMPATAAGQNNTARSAVALNCSKNTAYDVSLSSGAGLADASDPDRVAGVGNGGTQVIPVYEHTSDTRGNGDREQTGNFVMTINY